MLGLPQPPNRNVIEVKPVSDDAWVMVTNYRDFVLVGQDKAGNPT